MRNASLVSSYPTATFAYGWMAHTPQSRVRLAARCVANPAKMAEPLSLVGHSVGLNGDIT